VYFIIVVWQDGYRDGVTVGEESTLQDGRDTGFQHASFLFHLAKIHGSIAYVFFSFFI